MNDLSTFAVFGATGAQGAPVVTSALDRGLKVRAIARDTKKIEVLQPRLMA